MSEAKKQNPHGLGAGSADALVGYRLQDNDTIPASIVQDHDPIADRKLDMAERFGQRIEGAEPLLRPVRMAGFMQAEASVIDWAVHPYIPRGFLTLLGGHGGAGKSNLALVVVAHGACGVAWAGHYPGGVLKCLYVSLEDSGDLVRYRLRRICEEYNLDPELVAASVTVVDGTGGDGSLMVEVNDYGVRSLLQTALMVEVQILASGFDLIVIDNASDAFSGSEIERRSVRTFCRMLTAVAVKNNAAMVLLAHIDKLAARNGAGGNSYSGSTAWHNSARSRMALIPKEDGTVQLVHEKNNLGKCADPVSLRWTESGVLIPGAAGSGAGAADGDQSADADAVLEVLQVAIASGITVPTAASGPATAWHALQPLPELGQSFRLKDGKRRVHAALIRLGREGRIVRGLFKTAYRNERECWQLPHTSAGGDFVTTKSAADISPIPPTALPQHLGGAVVAGRAPTPATSATTAEQYRAATEGER